MRRRLIVLLIVILAAGGGFAWWWFGHGSAGSGPLVLYGNVDLRQVGSRLQRQRAHRRGAGRRRRACKVGDVARAARYQPLAPQVAQAEAQVAAQAAVVDKLHNGSRPEEIAQAHANVDAARADAAQCPPDLRAPDDAAGEHRRQSRPSPRARSTPPGRRRMRPTRSSRSSEQALALAKAGPRKEDIAQAEAQLEAAKAQLALLQQQLKDAKLTAPVDGVVRSRLLEARRDGLAAAAGLLARHLDPKWVRAYVSEPDLPKVRPARRRPSPSTATGASTFTGPCRLHLAGRRVHAASSIQTTELRTSLVYEVRVLVDDPDDVLRLGMPATVHLDRRADGATPRSNMNAAPAPAIAGRGSASCSSGQAARRSPRSTASR